MVGLCDCNNFYASCERVFNPSLNGRPVVVLSNNDGCIVARSEEAKRLGIKMGQPLYQAQAIIKANDVAVFSSNYQLYGDMSERVMTTLRSLVPEIEIYSIDEAFLNMEGMALDSLQEFGRNSARTVRRNTGIPVSIGIAPTKTLAKVASKLCKRYPKLQGCCLMYRPEDITKVLTAFPIEDVWGIGRRYAKMLKEYGITTAEQFRQSPSEWVRSKMGVVGLRTWQELHAEPCIEFEHTASDRQSIMVSRSFAKEIYEFEQLQEMVATFTTTACEKLRKQQSLAGELQLFLATNRHREDMPQYAQGHSITFTTPTDSTIEIAQEATKALKVIFRDGFGIKKAGVQLCNLMPNNAQQHTLFDTVDRGKHTTLMQTLDSLNAQMGRSTIKLASQGELNIRSNRDHASPRYTTEWSDIIVVKV